MEMMTETVSLSAELFAIPLDQDQFIVYAPLRKAAFVANSALVNSIAKISESGYLDSTDDHGIVEFLRSIEIVDGGEEEHPGMDFTGDPEPTSITLFLTTACNLRCTYCYAAAGDTPTKFMSLAVAEKGIDFILGNAQRKGIPSVEITYHGGGEPTVHWKVLTESLAYAKGRATALGIEVLAYSATNGVLTNDQIDWVIANLSGLSVSFDGLPSAQDRHRLTILGQGSSERVERTLRRLDAADFPYGIRVTVTADQIRNLPESIRYICSNFRPRKIQAEPAYQLGRWASAPSSETTEFIESFRRAEAIDRDKCHSQYLTAARVGVLTRHFCGITQDLFALSPEGNVSACYEVFAEDHPMAEKFFYGRPEGESYGFDLNVLMNLRGQTVDSRAFCSGCFAKWTCAGDCYHKSLTVSGEQEFAGSDRCHITRELTKDQILAKIAASGGLVWHEPLSSDLGTSPVRGKESLL